MYNGKSGIRVLRRDGTMHDPSAHVLQHASQAARQDDTIRKVCRPSEDLGALDLRSAGSHLDEVIAAIEERERKADNYVSEWDPWYETWEDISPVW